MFLTGALAGFLCIAAPQVAQQIAAARPEIPPGLDLYLPIPEENPLTAEKVALGRRLFFDPVLSRNRTIACATCHDPQFAFTDGLPIARGIENRTGRRNAPTLINRGYGRHFFWDGSIASLEEQALRPISDPNEFDSTIEEVTLRLTADTEYPGLFRAAFGRDPNADNLARAVAAYVRTIFSGESAFDRYLAGDRSALNEREREGLRLFRGKANCTACHLGPTFSDEKFHNTGVAWIVRDGAEGGEAWLADLGRFAVTKNEKDRGAFKTPTLREVERTAPYMHDGSMATLEDVVEFYSRGGNPNPHLDEEIKPLNLSPGEKQALVAFLKTLSGKITEGRLKPQRPADQDPQ